MDLEAPFIPFGGMNQDDSYVNPSPDGDGHSAFEGGDFRYAQNFRTGSTREGSLGDGENIRDTLPVSIYKVWDGAAWITGTAPSGNNFPVGCIEDAQLRKTFITFYNSSGNHSVVEYRPSEKAVYELLKWDLKLTKRYVSMSRVGNYIILTDKRNKPRIIDYTSIFALKATLGSSFCEFHISFSKWAPVAPLTVRYAAGFGGGFNTKLATGLFQFSYRYIFVGGFRSTWAPISNTACNRYLNNPIEFMNLDLPGLLYNSIAPNTPINHGNAEFYEVVEYIQFAYRQTSIDIWREFSKNKVTKSPGTNLGVLFYNSVVGTPLDVNDFAQAYDEVPLKSACTEVIDNRVMFGNNLEENEFFDEVDFVENVQIHTASSDAWYSVVAVQFTSLAPAEKDEVTKRNILRQHSFKSRSIIKLGVEFKDETGKKSLVYTTDSWIYTIPDSRPDAANFEPWAALGFNFKSGIKPPMWATSFQIMRTNCLNIDMFGFGVANKFVYLVDDTRDVTDYVTTDATRQAAIRDYFDVNDPTMPLSARLSSLVRKTKESGTSSSTAELAKASRVYIDINNWYNASKTSASDTDNPLNKLYYEFQYGDRVRFYGSAVSSPTADQVVIYDLLITEFNGQGIIVEKPSNLLWLPQPTAVPQFFIVEVYRPKKEVKAEDMIYYEMGEWYPVTNPGTVSRDFGKRDWVWTNHAGVTATTYGGHYIFHKLPVFAGDVHMVTKAMYADYASGRGNISSARIPVMNPDPDQVFGRWEKNNGRPNTAYTVKPLVAFKESQVRFSGKYLQDALYNNINNCRALDQYLYPQEYGAITEMVNTTSYQVESVGSILLILASVKSFSVYVNRTTLEDLGGRTQFLLSDKVLGAYNSLLGDNGCINPESISWSGRGNVYWWDQLNGSWIRYGRDGNTDISEEYKMSTWFKDIANLLEPLYDEVDEQNRPWVVSEFDNFHKELLVLMGDQQLVESLRGYTDYRGNVFNEKQNKWKFVHNYNVRMFARINNQVIGIKDGAIHILEGGTGYGTFFGEKFPIRVEPVFNIKSRQNKSWLTITEIASHKWEIERTLSEYFGSRVSQQSSLKLGKLQEKEFSFYSELMMDQNTPVFTDPELAEVTGDRLRSKILRVLLKLDDTVVVRSLLHQVFMGFTDSPKNK